MFIFYLGLLNEVPEHMAQECEHFKGLLRKLGVPNEVPEHMAQECRAARIRPRRSVSLLNEVPEHMAQELRDIHALTLGSLAPQ